MFKLESLPYSFDALNPYIDAQTMELHYTKHHQGYVNNLNATIKEYSELEGKTLAELLMNISSLPVGAQNSIRNNGGGHYNHTMFWKMMTPDAKVISSGKLYDAILDKFEGFDLFKAAFENAAKTRFGSGWAWLVVDQESGELEVYSTANQDCPIMDKKFVILGLDVWEHAYYLQYQNKRPDYISAWWNLVNWEFVEENYRQILGL